MSHFYKVPVTVKRKVYEGGESTTIVYPDDYEAHPGTRTSLDEANACLWVEADDDAPDVSKTITRYDTREQAEAAGLPPLEPTP